MDNDDYGSKNRNLFMIDGHQYEEDNAYFQDEDFG